MNKEFKNALKEYRELLAKIRNAGIPPHADFWHQSIYDAEIKIYQSIKTPPKENNQ